MTHTLLRPLGWTGALALGLACGLLASHTTARADDDSKPATDSGLAAPADNKNKEIPSYDLFEAMNKGLVSVAAEGDGQGRMTLSVHNRSSKQLRVVLPPGIVASGATGQFGGMGGGMGGGGMGGGMGGGGMGGGMGGGGMSMGGGTIPATMGMMTLSRLIMTLIGDRDSWDMRSMMGGMGGGMGGMGGGMGGMGGGMGGGMRSVPPTGAPSTTLKANQTRNLPTRLFSMTPPGDPNASVLPAKGEKLRISDITRKSSDPRVQAALKRLAEDKAPTSVATLVMWNVSGGMSWEQVADASKGWANAHELTLARTFVARLGAMSKDESGVLLYEVEGTSEASAALATELATLLKDTPVLGLKALKGVPAQPDTPAVACRIVVNGSEATVRVTTSDGTASAWHPEGQFTLPVTLENGKPQAVKFADAMAEGLLGRLVRAQLSKTGQMVKGKALYKIRIDNASPLILNGLAILGEGTTAVEKTPKVFSALSVSPRRSLTLPATADIVEQYGLRKGVRVIAADLSGL